MSQKEFLEKLCAILSQANDTDKGLFPFPCFCGNRPSNDRFNEAKARKFLELAEMFIQEI